MNDTGFNKFDLIGAIATIGGLVLSGLSIYSSYKGNQVRVNQLNRQLDPSIRQIPPKP
jgi:hypothetical protein